MREMVRSESGTHVGAVYDRPFLKDFAEFLKNGRSQTAPTSAC
jgi:hypothetical protein